MNLKLREFVEDPDGRGSASRLNMVVGILVGSFAVIYLTLNNNLGGEIFGTFMLASGGIYGFTKWRESVTEVAQIKADSPYPQEAPPQPIPEAVPATVINVGSGTGASKTEKVQDATIVAEGDVNVTKELKKKK